MRTFYRLGLLTLASIVMLAVPMQEASAQEREVLRRTFTFIENDLTVEIDATAPGELQIARGGLGRIDVAARAANGFAGLGLAGGSADRLVLTAMGAERVQYLVMVPAEVRVKVRLPGSDRTRTLTSWDRIARYSWEADAESEEIPAATSSRLSATPEGL